jgi:transposase
MENPTETTTIPEITEMKVMPKANRAWREGRRLRAWELHQQGWSQLRIAQALGVTQGAVSQWLKLAITSETGPQALLRRLAPGRAPRLNQAQLQQLAQWVREGASTHGFWGEVWTRNRVAQLIESRFAVKYHPSQVGRILKKIGFSLQKPIRQAHQRDEAAVEQWINQHWPTLKKNGSSKGA